MHLFSMCRQQAGHGGQRLGGARRHQGHLPGERLQDRRAQARSTAPRSRTRSSDPYQQEHTDFIASIRKGEPISELKMVTESTATAIMGREAAYTGKVVTFDEIINGTTSILPPAIDLTASLPTPPVADAGREHELRLTMSTTPPLHGSQCPGHRRDPGRPDRLRRTRHRRGAQRRRRRARRPHRRDGRCLQGSARRVAHDPHRTPRRQDGGDRRHAASSASTPTRSCSRPTSTTSSWRRRRRSAPGTSRPRSRPASTSSPRSRWPSTAPACAAASSRSSR